MTLYTSQEAGCSPRRLTRSQLRDFAPKSMAKTHDEEIGYRRGFDQGVAALAYAIGIENSVLQRLAWKRRVTDFRHGRLAESPFWATASEITEIREAVGRA